MTLYILSRYDSTGLGNTTDGVWGAFDTLEKAKLEASLHIQSLGEAMLDWDEDGVRGLWNYFTDKGTYHIESIVLNDSCFK